MGNEEYCSGLAEYIHRWHNRCVILFHQTIDMYLYHENGVTMREIQVNDFISIILITTIISHPHCEYT